MSAADAPPLCGTLLRVGTRPLDTAHGGFVVHEFLDLTARQPALVLTRGDCGGEAPLLARVHSSCVTSESFGGADCDCAGQLDAALERIARAGRGALFYLLQEGRGAGLVAKARDRMLVQASRDRVTTFDAYARMGLDRDYRRYDAVAFAAAALGLRAPLALLSNNPEKVAALRDAGVAITAVEGLERAPSPFNLHYLTAKSRSGHALQAAAPPAGAATPPEPVTAFEPTPLAALPRFMRVAQYLLPVRAEPPAEGVHWLRVHLYVDGTSGRERVIFSVPAGLKIPPPPPSSKGGIDVSSSQGERGGIPLVHVTAERLLERLPRRPRRDDWRAAVAALAARGAGCALCLLHDDPELARHGSAAAAVAADADLARLIAHHLPGRAELYRDDAALAAALRAAGVALA
ncbi:MAG: GTP cyclohydrolase II [Deltaproteobacteria bacterium]|nr:GTP cyclohydrolase II [Deltaproteobacteria bacterium]